MDGTAKKIGIAALLGYAAFWIYNNVVKATDRLIYGTMGWGGIQGGSIVLTLPISNVGQLPLKMTGMQGTLVLLGDKVVGNISQVQATTFAPNSTQTLQIRVSPNWVTLASVIGAAGVAAVQSGQYAEVLGQLQPTIKATIYTPAFTETFTQQIA